MRSARNGRTHVRLTSIRAVRSAQTAVILPTGWRRRKFDPKTSQAGGAAEKPRTLSRGSFRFRTLRSSPSDSVNLKPPLGEINSNSDNLASIVACGDLRHAIRKRSYQHERIFSAVGEKTHRVDRLYMSVHIVFWVTSGKTKGVLGQWNGEQNLPVSVGYSARLGGSDA
jgi:hypothetical protein